MDKLDFNQMRIKTIPSGITCLQVTKSTWTKTGTDIYNQISEQTAGVYHFVVDIAYEAKHDR
jgi:hypothetical protein